MDNCYFCDKKVLKEGYLLSCTSHCFKKCHLHCFRHYENYEYIKYTLKRLEIPHIVLERENYYLVKEVITRDIIFILR